MASIVGLIFLVALMAVISFGNGDSTKTIEESKIDIEVPYNITKLVNLITLKNTYKLWNKPKFHDCLEGESYHFFMPVVSFTQNLTSLIQKFNNTNEDNNRSLADEIYKHVNKNRDLIEQARRIITQAAKKKLQYDDENLKRHLSPIEKKLISNFKNIDEKLFKIQCEDKKLAKIIRIYKKNIRTLKRASKKLVQEIRRCQTE